MGKLNIATAAQAEDWPERVNALIKYVKKNPNAELYKTVHQLVEDNIKLFNRVQELEKGESNGKTNDGKS